MEVLKQTDDAAATLESIDPNLVPESWLLDKDDDLSPAPPPAKKKRLPLSLKKTRAKSASRFAPPSEVHFAVPCLRIFKVLQ